MFAGKKSAQIREILISESAWEEMTCLFAPSLGDKGQVVSMYRPLKQDMVIDEVVYFSDIDKPNSLSNFHLSMKG